MVKTLIFDFGNVLINLDFDRCFNAFEELLQVDWSKSKVPPSIQEAIIQYDKGLISNEEFVSAFIAMRNDVEFDQVKEAWNYLIADMPSTRFEFLENLRNHYQLVLLSNINAFHVDRVHEILDIDHGVRDFEGIYFDKVFYSHLIGKRKPEKDIYQYVQAELKLKPHEILFIDDIPENIEAAKAQGWYGQVHDPLDNIELMLGGYLDAISD